MGWLGLDDTDHIGGGCTTHALFELIQNLPKQYVVSSQRLVRLYPFAKQRTRGNAAVAIKIEGDDYTCLLYTSPSPRDGLLSRMPSSA